MDCFCNQNADQLGSLAGLSFPVVYVGVAEYTPVSPYTYSSSTHRFPDELTPIEATPLSATSVELGLGLGLGLGLDKPLLVVPHTTCPSLFHFPPRTQLYNRSCSNKHTHCLCFSHIPVDVEVQLSLIPTNSITAPAGMYRDAIPIIPKGYMWSCPGRATRPVSVLGFCPGRQ